MGSIVGSMTTLATTDPVPVDHGHTGPETPWEPPLAGTETEALPGALDRLRWTFRHKADGLDAAAVWDG